MKSIIKELKQNKAMADEEGKAYLMLKETADVKAREILEQSIRRAGYDPSEIFAISMKTLVGKKETTVQFRLSPRGYGCTEDHHKPTVLVHLKPDSGGYIVEATLLRALLSLAKADWWKEEKGKK